jgi:hypothetical protein
LDDIKGFIGSMGAVRTFCIATRSFSGKNYLRRLRSFTSIVKGQQALGVEGTTMNRLVAIALLSAFSAFAQTNRGAITGTITDQSPSGVPGATITITNLGTNEVRKTTSRQTGPYSARDLDPDT